MSDRELRQSQLIGMIFLAVVAVEIYEFRSIVQVMEKILTNNTFRFRIVNLCPKNNLSILIETFEFRKQEN